jgi:LysM repeat protein
MGNIGNFGDISFYCSSVNGSAGILSFYDLQRSSSAGYSEHERNGGKPYLEFNTDGLDELSLSIVADARYGVKPREVQDRLYSAKQNAQAENFILGGYRIGDNPYVITEITQTYQLLASDGRPIKLCFNLISTIPSAATNAVEAAPAVSSSDTYTVVKGDTLWAIAKKYYGSGSQYTRIYNANKDKISNPNKIYPGQVLTIPK